VLSWTAPGGVKPPVASRRELGRDKSKSLFVLVGASVALLLFFFGVFSNPKSRTPLPGETARGGPSLGRKVSPGQEQNDPAKTVTPLLSADVNRGMSAPDRKSHRKKWAEPRLVITERQDCPLETPLRWKSPHRAGHEVPENMRSRTWISPIPRLLRQPRSLVHPRCIPPI